MSKHGVIVTPQSDLGACSAKVFALDGNGMPQMRMIRVETAFVVCVWKLLQEIDLEEWTIDDLGSLFINPISFDMLATTLIARLQVIRPDWNVTVENIEHVIAFLDSLESEKFVIPVPKEVSMMASALA